MNAPGNAFAGLAMQGIGAVTGKDVSQHPDVQNLTDNIQKTGTVARVALPVAAGIATAGMSIPASAGISALAGAAGRGIKETTDAATGADDQSLAGRAGDVVKEGLITGAVDGTVGVGLRMAGKAIPALSKGLKQSARNVIQKVLAPTTNPMKKTAENVTEGILKRPMKETFSLTRKGLEAKASAAKEVAGEAIDEFGELAGKTPVSTIVDALEAEKAAFVAGGKVVDPDAVAQIEGVQDIFRQYGKNIDDETMRTVRRIFDRTVSQSKGFQKTLKEGTELDVKKTAANKIRGILAEKNPVLGELNKEFTFWSNLEDVIEATNKRTVGQQGAMTTVAGIAGAATGNSTVESVVRLATFRWLAEAFRSTGWRMVNAQLKDNLAEALGNRNFMQALKVSTKIGTQLGVRPLAE